MTRFGRSRGGRAPFISMARACPLKTLNLAEPSPPCLAWLGDALRAVERDSLIPEEAKSLAQRNRQERLGLI